MFTHFVPLGLVLAALPATASIVLTETLVIDAVWITRVLLLATCAFALSFGAT